MFRNIKQLSEFNGSDTRLVYGDAEPPPSPSNAPAEKPTKTLAALREEMEQFAFVHEKTLQRILLEGQQYKSGDWSKLNKRFTEEFEKEGVGQERSEALLKRYQKDVFSDLGLTGDELAVVDGKLGAYTLYAFAIRSNLPRPKVDVPSGCPKLEKLINEDAAKAFEQYQRYPFAKSAKLQEFKRIYADIKSSTSLFNPNYAKLGDWALAFWQSQNGESANRFIGFPDLLMISASDKYSGQMECVILQGGQRKYVSKEGTIYKDENGSLTPELYFVGDPMPVNPYGGGEEGDKKKEEVVPPVPAPKKDAPKPGPKPSSPPSVPAVTPADLDLVADGTKSLYEQGSSRPAHYLRESGFTINKMNVSAQCDTYECLVGNRPVNVMIFREGKIQYIIDGGAAKPVTRTTVGLKGEGAAFVFSDMAKIADYIKREAANSESARPTPATATATDIDLDDHLPVNEDVLPWEQVRDSMKAAGITDVQHPEVNIFTFTYANIGGNLKVESDGSISYLIWPKQMGSTELSQFPQRSGKIPAQNPKKIEQQMKEIFSAVTAYRNEQVAYEKLPFIDRMRPEEIAQ